MSTRQLGHYGRAVPGRRHELVDGVEGFVNGEGGIGNGSDHGVKGRHVEMGTADQDAFRAKKASRLRTVRRSDCWEVGSTTAAKMVLFPL